MLFAMSCTIASAVLWTIFLEAAFRAYSPVLVAVSNNFFPYFLDRFVTSDKYPYPLTYFLVLDSIK